MMEKTEGLLKGKRTYLAGAIEHVTQSGATRWRDDLTPKLKEFGIMVFDPCRSQEEHIEFQRGHIIELKRARQFEALQEKMKRVVRQDLRCVDLADFVIVYLPSGVQSTGTIHELVQADWQKKPTLLVSEDRSKIPDWIFGILPLRYMFESFEALIEYLKIVDKGYIKDDMRWQFLEFE